MTYTTENEKDFNQVLPTSWLKEKKIVLPNQKGNGWYIFNLQSIGKFQFFHEIYYNLYIKYINIY